MCIGTYCHYSIVGELQQSVLYIYWSPIKRGEGGLFKNHIIIHLKISLEKKEIIDDVTVYKKLAPLQRRK